MNQLQDYSKKIKTEIKITMMRPIESSYLTKKTNINKRTI